MAIRVSDPNPKIQTQMEDLCPFHLSPPIQIHHIHIWLLSNILITYWPFSGHLVAELQRSQLQTPSPSHPTMAATCPVVPAFPWLCSPCLCPCPCRLSQPNQPESLPRLSRLHLTQFDPLSWLDKFFQPVFICLLTVSDIWRLPPLV